MSVREIPPTAGLPLALSDFVMAAFGGGLEPGCFEARLADFLGASDLSIFSSGSLCLSLAFEAVKEVSGRKRVILPAYTCPLVPIAAYNAGVEVVLCDTRQDSFEFDLDMLAHKCDDSIAAVVPTDLAGLPCDIAAVNEIASACGAYVIEDAAQALGASRKGRAAGAAADIAVYSLACGKGLSLFDGGIIALRDDANLKEALKNAASLRIKRQPHLNMLRFLQLVGLFCLYNPVTLPFVYGNELRHWLKRGDLVRAVGEHFDLELPAYEFGELRKRIGVHALSRLPHFLESNRRTALARCRLIREELGLKVLAEDPDSIGSWPFLMLLAGDMQTRDRIMGKLWQSGLGVTRLFIHELTAYDYLKEIVPQQDMPNARSFAQRSLTVSNSHWLKDDEFGAILRCIKVELQQMSRVSPEAPSELSQFQASLSKLVI